MPIFHGWEFWEAKKPCRTGAWWRIPTWEKIAKFLSYGELGFGEEKTYSGLLHVRELELERITTTAVSWLGKNKKHEVGMGNLESKNSSHGIPRLGWDKKIQHDVRMVILGTKSDRPRSYVWGIKVEDFLAMGDLELGIWENVREIVILE